MTVLKTALIQQSCTDDRETTLAKTEKMIRQAATSGAELVILQELHTSLYFCQTETT
jgi:N-carbamoylputrescine amidase